MKNLHKQDYNQLWEELKNKLVSQSFMSFVEQCQRADFTSVEALDFIYFFNIE